MEFAPHGPGERHLDLERATDLARLRARRFFTASLIAKAAYYRRHDELAELRARLADV
jgi:hypothetical protein